MESQISFKILLVGDGAVGKSTLIRKLSVGDFIPQAITKGLNHTMYDAKVGNNTVTLMIWDLGGQRQFVNINASQIKGAHAVVYCFDLSQLKSLNNVRSWARFVNQNKTTMMIPYLMGNKSDLNTARDDLELITQISKDLDIKEFWKTSAKLGINIKEPFEIIAADLFESMRLRN